MAPDVRQDARKVTNSEMQHGCCANFVKNQRPTCRHTRRRVCCHPIQITISVSSCPIPQRPRSPLGAIRSKRPKNGQVRAKTTLINYVCTPSSYAPSGTITYGLADHMNDRNLFPSAKYGKFASDFVHGILKSACASTQHFSLSGTR